MYCKTRVREKSKSWWTLTKNRSLCLSFAYNERFLVKQNKLSFGARFGFIKNDAPKWFFCLFLLIVKINVNALIFDTAGYLSARFQNESREDF